jgi:carbon storage regulator
MLVLSRKPNQQILIGDDIRVTVVGIRGNQVRLGIEAPDAVKIYREELCTAATASGRGEPVDAAAGWEPTDDRIGWPR